MTALPLSSDLRRRLIALTGCASSDKARPVLASVCFDGDHAWGTDSYVLARVPLPESVDGRLLVPAKPLARYLRDAPKTADVTLELTKQCAALKVVRTDLLTEMSQTTTLGYVGGDFPDMEKLWPDEVSDSDERPAFAASYLERVAACGPLLQGNNQPVAARLHSQGAMKPLVVEHPDGETVGLIMPIVTDEDRKRRRKAA